MTQIMILKRDAIENVPWTLLSARVECVRGGGGRSDRLGIQKCGLSPSEVSSYPHVRSPKMRICLHCRWGKLQDESWSLFSSFSFQFVRMGEKSPRPLLLGVRFPPIHINNLLSLAPPLPPALVLFGSPIA